MVGTNLISGGSGSRYRAEFTTYHEKFDAMRLRNDIGLIRVKTDIEFTDKIKPISLPTTDFNDFNSSVTLTGWGRTSVIYFCIDNNSY